MTTNHVGKIAVLGAGTIGLPIALNLRAAGLSVTVWNRTAARTAGAQKQGLNVAATAREGVEDADVVFTVVKDAAAVQDILESTGDAFRPGAILVQMSTIGPTGTSAIGRLAAERGLILVDAPVQGTKGPAESGQLLVLAAGALAHRARVAPLFDAIGKKTLWVSETPGAASSLKLVLNTLVSALTHGVAEAFTLADALQVDPNWVLEAIVGSPLDSPFAVAKAKAIMAGDFSPSFTVDNAIKDGRLITDTAGAAGLWLPLSRAGLARFESAAAHGHGGDDIAASYFATTSGGQPVD
ncbi:NAD(P)-dependent oxidoreductase [Leifsonia shinshuensis]